MSAKCFSKCLLFVRLALALFLSRDLSAAASGGSSGGRMGGWTHAFGSYRSPPLPKQPASSHSRPPSSFFSGFSSVFSGPRPFIYSPATNPFVYRHHGRYYNTPASSYKRETETECECHKSLIRYQNNINSYKKYIDSKRESYESLIRDLKKNTNDSVAVEKKESDKNPVGNKNEDCNIVVGYRTILLCGIVIVACVLLYQYYDPYEAQVLMVQVGLPGTAESLQRDLNWIARNTNTDDKTGFHQVLLDTVTVLFNHQNHWISGFSYVDKKTNIGESERIFKQLSFEERKKVDLESLVNVNGVREERICKHRANNLGKNFIVVTVLVAARGCHELPPIKTAKDLKKAVQTLSSISLNQAMAVEVLWTPQNENDTMSEDEYLEDYYRLKPI